jgi:2-aminoethylphosphonate-pyruvate transaminase
VTARPSPEHFETFYELLRRRGYVIYSGKLTVADSFRVGCIGHLGETDMRDALLAMETVLKEMGVLDCRPKSSVPAPAP